MSSLNPPPQPRAPHNKNTNSCTLTSPRPPPIPGPPGTLSHFFSLSTSIPSRFLSTSSSGNITLKCLLKSITTPDITSTLQTLKLRSYSSPFNLTKIHSLLLSGNRIKTTEGITSCLRDYNDSINTECCMDECYSISLADNLIEDIEEVFRLSSIQSLRSLIVTGNPCQKNTSQNRFRIICSFRGRLKVLDGLDCSSLSSIDHAVKGVMFEGEEGRRLVGMSEYMFELDRVVCALRVKDELRGLYGEESSFNSSIESLGEEERQEPFKKLIKVWKNKNVKGLEREKVVKNLQRRLNMIIKKTRRNRHAIEPEFLQRLSAQPDEYFEDVEEDWRAAFKGVMMPIEREVERLELECKTLTGEVEDFEVGEEEMRDIEKSAIMFGGSELGEEEEVNLTADTHNTRVNQAKEMFFDEIASLPSTPPGSVKSNMPLPAFEDEEHYRKEKTKETYNQLLQKMEKGKLHDKDYKKQKNLEEAGEWVHPPTLSSPPRKVKGKGGGKVKSPDPLHITLEDINMSRTIQKMNEVHELDDPRHHESVAWDVLKPEDMEVVIKATPDVEWKLPVPPTLNPPPRVPLPEVPIPPPLLPTADNMKKLQSQSESLFEAMCDNHEVHLSLFQINSALRKCADSFSNARNRYLMSIQAKMMYLESLMMKWKKEDPKLKKAVEDAGEYIGKINKIEEAKEKAVYDLHALKRHTKHLHKTIDVEREDHERLVEVQKSVSARIEEANKKLGNDEREQILKDRELEKRGKAFVARFSLRVCFKLFRARVSRQKDIKIFAGKCRNSFDRRVKFYRFLRWRNYLRELKSVRLKVKTVETIRTRKVWRSVRAAYKIHAISTRHARLRMLRVARSSISHWHNLSKAKKNVEKIMNHMSSKALLKNVLLRWRRFLRFSNLSPGELREGLDKAVKKYKQFLLRRWRRFVDQARAAIIEKNKAVTTIQKKKVCQTVMDRWYFKFSVASYGRRALLRRMYTHWKVTWTVRKAAVAFWNAATHHDDLKLKRKVFMPWRREARGQAKLLKERRAMRIMLKCSSTASVSNSFFVWKRIYDDFKKIKRNTKKAILHYFSKLSRVYFGLWFDFVQLAMTVSRILPLFANVSQKGKFMFAWRKWRNFTLDKKRESNVAKGVEKTAIAFLKRMLGAAVGSCFFAWQGFAEKRRRCRLNARVIEGRVLRIRKQRGLRTWVNSFVISKIDVWRSQESSYEGGGGDDVGTKARLSVLSSFLQETQETLDEDSSCLYGLEAELSRAQGELMERQMKLDSKLHKLEVVEGRVNKADEKWKVVEVSRLKVQEKLTVTKLYFKNFKKRPEEEKWSLGSSKSGGGDSLGLSSGSGTRSSGSSSRSTNSATATATTTTTASKSTSAPDVAVITEEKIAAIAKKNSNGRLAKSLKQQLADIVNDRNKKIDAHREKKLEADRKCEDIRIKVEALKKETEKLRVLKEKHEQDVSRVGVVTSTMASSYVKDLNRLTEEERELKERLEAAEKRQHEIDSVLWRKNAEIRGLREEAKTRKGRGRKPDKYVFKSDAEVLATVAEARSGTRVKETKVLAEGARKSSSEQVKHVIDVYDEAVIEAEEGSGEEEEDGGGSRKYRKSRLTRSTSSRSSRGVKGGSGGVPSRLMQKIGLQKRRSAKNEGNVKSLAAGKLIAAKREHAHVRTQVAITNLSENLFDETTVLENSESLSLKKDIDRLSGKIMKRL
ncbi:hypothetical protein TrLO_g394 [Triparma laevis f. longispina]|uniref:Uncharacterized protein n=1 Tax=Triparma laevis f. longispina TaxID=1714387 RepID=A0A9W7KSA5_9STRA|nr:hypothetical protein TrLO_g394 [Triparma laevis f. longispina]